jgi:SAM-dependent methyltransferase
MSEKIYNTEDSRGFWMTRTNNSPNNRPVAYANATLDRTKELYRYIEDYIDSEYHIIEVGCNVGRNLNYLYSKDVRKLIGVEINPEALKMGSELYVDMFNDSSSLFLNGAAGDILPTLNNGRSINLCFTMAVMIHMSNEEQDFTMKWISKNCNIACFIELVEGQKRLGSTSGHFHNPLDINYNILVDAGFKITTQEKFKALQPNGPYTITILKRCRR